MPLQFHLASQTGQAQKRRLPGCRLGGGGRKLVREGYTGQEPRIRSPSQASDQPASAQLLHSPSFAESCAQSPVSAAERVVAGLPWRAPVSCSLQRDQVNKVAGERPPCRPLAECWIRPACRTPTAGHEQQKAWWLRWWSDTAANNWRSCCAVLRDQRVDSPGTAPSP